MPRHIVNDRNRWILLGASLLLMAGCTSPEEGPEKIEAGGPECAQDNQSVPANAKPIATMMPESGYLCPVEDQDWYTFALPNTDKILTVEMEMAATLSPIELTYAIFPINDAGDPMASVATSSGGKVGEKLRDVHCIDSGKYAMVVRDKNDDAQDFRHKYNVTVTTQADPDTQEPNDEAGPATTLTSGEQVDGWIACRGDEDWYKIDVPEGNLVRILYESDITGYEPTVRLLDSLGEQVLIEDNPRGTVAATTIDRFEVLPREGTYYVVISDDDNQDADPNVGYQLTVEFVEDRDLNEPNNEPATATPISQDAVPCSVGGSQEYTFTGTIGSPGDNDWFVVPTRGCTRGLIEANVEMSTSSWELNNEVQASLTLVREHAGSACDNDEDCTSLNIACEGPADCSGFFENCLAEGLCAGAVVCLPGGSCGANVVQRYYSCNPNDPGCTPNAGSPPPNRAEISAPIYLQDRVYLRVSDFQADGADPDTTYTLKVRLRDDPDGQAEKNNAFSNRLTNDVNASWHEQFAQDIPIHDCTSGDCCSGSTWVSGTIAYENDLDWYKYPHPCPGQDCTLRFHYQLDGGPVDFLMNVFRNNRPWLTGFPIEEMPMQGGRSGVQGGTTAQDECFYAWQGHNNNNGTFYYFVEVRDLLTFYPDRITPRPESRDWDPNQTYRFCVEKVQNSCAEPPCMIYDNGCGPPM